MAKRGRKSVAQLSVAPTKLEPIERPQPPALLSEPARQVWLDTFGAQAALMFAGMFVIIDAWLF